MPEACQPSERGTRARLGSLISAVHLWSTSYLCALLIFSLFLIFTQRTIQLIFSLRLHWSCFIPSVGHDKSHCQRSHLPHIRLFQQQRWQHQHQSAYLETIRAFFFPRPVALLGFSPCLGRLVLSQFLWVEVLIRPDSDFFFLCGGNGRTNM